MTPQQRVVLERAIADGGEIVMTGIDQTEPRPDRRTVNSLIAMGYLRYAASPQIGFGVGLNDYLRITDSGKEALK